MYCIDTNILIDWWESRYPPDIFPCVESAMSDLARKNLIVAPERVLDELQHIGSSGLKAWAKANRGIFVPHDVDLQREANNIQKQYPGLIDLDARHDEADRYIIALARLRKFSVVTHETAAKSKRHPARSYYIPDVCAGMSVRCLIFTEVMREQKWKF